MCAAHPVSLLLNQKKAVKISLRITEKNRADMIRNFLGCI